MPTPRGAVAAAGGNLRAGPGTDYPVIGQVSSGQSLSLAARSPDGAWYQTADGAWIFSGLVSGAESLPVAANLPTRPAAQPAAATAAPTPAAASAACPAWYQRPEPDKAVMIFENHNTGDVYVEEVNVSGAGTGAIKVDSKDGDRPGRHAFQLAPGRHTFDINTPGATHKTFGLDVEAGRAYIVPYIVVLGQKRVGDKWLTIREGDVQVYPLEPPAGCS